ncbi:inner membrane CreD family protein [Silvibacterium dinghuense]|uniref:Inner membrane protein CreD n=1 Tax=Silvibacterium dinghuense TaxID=1560006 RepID=A0A4Q1SBJ8_9BACT|nr:inner membrane CreD family protein [Silvibacterium dinghuense]RXS94496.1 hypothetical protein ESZ00_15630 [Silvibacterium dinghuense]GGH15733.1 hypothetical protein GCM10011586_37040 [Silvibacterium dinghuense]
MDTLALQESKDWNPRSMGMKLLLLSVLALCMTIPSFFVSDLASERSQAAVHGAAAAQNTPSSRLPIRTVDSYRSVTRSLKYVLLFLGLVFLTYFVFEATTGTRVHPAQYVLVGTAQLIFYLLLLSLAEKVGFDWAFLIAGGATVALLSTNAGWIFAGRSQGWRALAVFGPLYMLIYLLLRLEDDALLIGAIMSFLAVAAAMYFTRRIDWYSARSGKEKVKAGSGPEFFQGLV